MPTPIKACAVWLRVWEEGKAECSEEGGNFGDAIGISGADKLVGEEEAKRGKERGGGADAVDKEGVEEEIG